MIPARILLLCLCLTACGFRPLYNTSGSQGEKSSVFLSSIQIDDIPDRSGVILKNELIDRFHAHGAGIPRYRLVVGRVTESISDLDITVDEDATRRQLRVDTTYTLQDLTTPSSPAFKRSIYAVASFNVLQSRFTTRVAEDNARQNVILDLARQIEQGVMMSDVEKGR